MTADRPARRLPVALEARLDRLRSSLWFIPGAFAVGTVVTSWVLVWLDHLLDAFLAETAAETIFSWSPESARLVLSTISAAMLTFTGLVFSVTMLVLQQASSQLSPRVMRAILRDRVNQGVLGLFVATFLYALLVLRDVLAPDVQAGPFVPQIAVSFAYLLLLASVGAFIYYIHHMANALRTVSVLRSVAGETRGTIDRVYPDRLDAAEPTAEDGPAASPEPLPDRPPDDVVTLQRGAGVVVSVDDQALLRIAREHRLVVEVTHQVGDFVASGAPILHIWRQPDTSAEASPAPAGEAAAASIPEPEREEERELPLNQLTSAIRTGIERTMSQDASFGFRQIVDIATRALSPGTNDPSTAVQALDEIHDLLRRLAGRVITAPVQFRDEESGALVHLPRPDWGDFVALALDEIRIYGTSSLQVARRLRYLLLDLQGVVSGTRELPVARQLRLLDEGLPQGFSLREDRRSAGEASASGQGPGEEPPPEPPPEPSEPPEESVATTSDPVAPAGEIEREGPPAPAAEAASRR